MTSSIEKTILHRIILGELLSWEYDLHTCRYVCIYIYIHDIIYIYIRIVCIYIRIVYIYICMYLSIYVSMYLCIYVAM